MRTVMLTLNGQLRPVVVRDESIEVLSRSAEKADPTVPGHVAAPFSGVVTLKVEPGAVVAQGEQIAVIEAMKMEAAITAPVPGTIRRLAVTGTARVDAGDLIIEIA